MTSSLEQKVNIITRTKITIKATWLLLLKLLLILSC